MNLKKIKEQFEDISSLKTVTEAYTEIASLDLRKIRSQVEGNRAFFADLSEIFALLRIIAEKRISNYKLPGNGKAITILFTSNFRFNGRVVRLASDYFLDVIKKSPTDKLVIGRLGKEYLESRGLEGQFKSLIFRQDLPDFKGLQTLVDAVSEYSQIFVVYSHFRTVLSQTPVLVDITQKQISETQKARLQNVSTTYLLEPEIEKMISFFDSQIKNILLQEVFLESQLAMIASRLNSMEQAQTKAKKMLEKEDIEMQIAKRQLSNKKILENWFSSHYGNILNQEAV